MKTAEGYLTEDGRALCSDRVELRKKTLTLREIIKSIDKKLDYSVREAQGSNFALLLNLRGHEALVLLSLDDLKAAKTDAVKKYQLRQKIKFRRDHIDQSRFNPDVLELKAAKLLRSSPKPEATFPQRGFARAPRR